jgi:hypothetical protein
MGADIYTFSGFLYNLHKPNPGCLLAIIRRYKRVLISTGCLVVTSSASAAEHIHTYIKGKSEHTSIENELYVQPNCVLIYR